MTKRHAPLVPLVQHGTPRLKIAIASEPSVLTKRSALLVLILSHLTRMIKLATASELSVLTIIRALHAIKLGLKENTGSTTAW